MKHAVLMGDPAYFRIKSGKNPYTRTRWGVKKKVDLPKAVYQWNKFKDTLESLGAKVFVLPPQKDNPSMVFPANAGFLFPKYEPLPWPQKRFILSSLSPHRRDEAAIYRDFLAPLGLQTQTLPYPFEGEADFFPSGEFYIFCYGDIVPTGFRPACGWPPYRYRFSHRSDRKNRDALQGIVGENPIIDICLTDVRYYHGDTVFSAFGPNREYLLAYLEAMDEASRVRLKKYFGARLIPLSKTDAENFTANSFQLDTPSGPHLVFPDGVSEEVKKKVADLGFSYTLVDVSEFFMKGGGSIKCLLCDLGPWC